MVADNPQDADDRTEVEKIQRRIAQVLLHLPEYMVCIC